MDLFSFDSLTFAFGHLFRKSFISVCLDVADTRCTVGIEQESKDFPHPIGIQPAGFYIFGTFCTGMELVCLAARPDFTPTCLFVLFASRTSFCKKLAAGPAVQTTSGNISGIGNNRFHQCSISVWENSLLIQKVASSPVKCSST